MDKIANLKNRRWFKWTVKVYHIRGGNASTISYSYLNTEKRSYSDSKLDVQGILSALRKYKGVEVVDGAVCADRVHMCVSIPPKISVSNFMGYLKGLRPFQGLDHL